MIILTIFLGVTTFICLLGWVLKIKLRTYYLGTIIDKNREISTAELTSSYYLVISHRKDGVLYTEKIEVTQEAFDNFNIKDRVII